MLSRSAVRVCPRQITSALIRRQRISSTSATRALRSIQYPARRRGHLAPINSLRAFASSASQSAADLKIEEIQELYATAKDEFEIAAEETEKQTVYAEDDRAAAREELTKLQNAYKAAIEDPDQETADEVKRRVGQRIRELENAVVAMEEMAQNQD